MKFVTSLSDTIFKIEKVLAVIIATIMLASLVLGVLFRYVFNAPLFWSDEVAIFSLAWATFIGGSMTIKAQQAVCVTLIVDKLSGLLRKVVIILGLFIALLFCCFIVYLSFTWITSPTILLQKSNAIQLPMIYPYLSVPVGIFFMTIHAIHLFLESLRAAEGKVI